MRERYYIGVYTGHIYIVIHIYIHIYIYTYMYIYILVGGLEHDFYDLPYIGNNDPTDELIFFRGVETTNQYMCVCVG